MGALSKFDEFLLNPQVRTCSAAVPGKSRNINSESRKTTGNRSLDNPCPETIFSSHHSGNLNSSEVEDYSHVVSRGPEEIRNRPPMMTDLQEEVPYCSSCTSSGKQKQVRSTSQPQFHSENNLATIEADQFFVGPSTIGNEQ